MNILLAPDSFKGSLTSVEAAAAMERGLRRVWPAAVVEAVPMADGGEGTTEALIAAVGGQMVRQVVRGPRGAPVEAGWGILADGKTAVIEMAAASGLVLLAPAERNPLLTTTYGTGELLRSALDAGCRRILLGIGGSATNDGGAGMARALGVRFLDAQGKELAEGGGDLCRLAVIDRSGLDPRLLECEVIIACDVDNPLCGPQGAAAVYGPQKGATPAMVAELDANLAHYARLIASQLGLEVADQPGAGAAGGLGAGLLAFAGGKLQRGIEVVLAATHLAERLAEQDLVLTGEGSLDAQTERGKVPWGVARLAREQGVPVIAIAGRVDSRLDLARSGFAAALSITPGPVTLPEAMDQAAQLVELAAERAAALVAVGMALGKKGFGGKGSF